MAELESVAEQRALRAQELTAFDGLNLVGLKSKVEEILRLVGRDGFFRSYTLHDISHIDKMLGLLDWVIPEETQAAMSPADWLLVVMSIYFHDLAMLVTKDEFEARGNSGFQEWCDDVLFFGPEGSDYRAKVRALGDEAEVFLYEEFVRAHHAARIAEWVRGRHSTALGDAAAAAAQVDEMLRGLPKVFREDLARVCESHHLADLADTTKYRVEQPYGDSDRETANVQYAAILLRTTDLLHVTADRTPSVLFKLINPQDPISQVEWAKQAAVRRVKAQKGKDRDGRFSEAAERDTVEVIAEFENAEGFFGLTSYLRYAEQQLAQSHEWAATSQATFDVPHRFPWRRIDDSQVGASGFSPRRLEFRLDQTKILELLTGHTLYNDTSVVVRELVQNAIDAARLQALIDGVDASSTEVAVRWDGDARELTVRDTGTGMTQAVIENNLLKAGASRYQEEDFQKRFAAFSPISRFGIGVLSAFMIADSVEVVTSSPDEPEARALTLRSVHGRYLVELLDKSADPRAMHVGAHGTEIKLRLRESARLPDVLGTLQKWIVVPRCSVTAQIDTSDPVPVGFDSPRGAIEAVFAELGVSLWDGGDPSDGVFRVVERVEQSVTTAFAVRWDRYFREWGFVTANELPRRGTELAYGTCVEGIRVEETSAGYKDLGIVAVSNACGPGAPKTNVARSGIEATLERTAMLRSIYGAFLGHVAEEAETLGAGRGLSLTWAAQEAEFLLRPLLLADGPTYGRREASVEPVEPAVLTSAVRSTPIVLAERDGSRELYTVAALQDEAKMWTVDSAYVRAAERLLREIPGAVSLSSVSEGFKTGAFDLPEGVTLVGYQSYSPLYQTVLQGLEVCRIVIRRDERRVDLAWAKSTAEKSWLAVPAFDSSGTGRYARGAHAMFVARDSEIQIEGREEEVAVRAHGIFYLFPDTPLAAFLRDALPPILDDRSRRPVCDFVQQSVVAFLGRSQVPDNVREFVEVVGLRDMDGSRRPLALIEENLDLAKFVDALETTGSNSFDTSGWSRRDSYLEF